MIEHAVEEHAGDRHATGVSGMGVAPATIYRRRQPPKVATTDAAPAKRAVPARTLSAAERDAVRTVLHSERTMYRILAEWGEVRERRDQLMHPPYVKPELLATQPNQVWSWDMTKLLGPAKWTTTTCMSSSTCSVATWSAGRCSRGNRRRWRSSSSLKPSSSSRLGRAN